MDISNYVSEYIKPDDVGNGIVVIFKNAGEETEGQYGTRVEFEIEMPDKTIKNWTPNKTSLSALASAFGKDTAKWVSREVTLKVAKVQVQGKMKDAIFGEPFKATA